MNPYENATEETWSEQQDQNPLVHGICLYLRPSLLKSVRTEVMVYKI
jgi:hypothetical protein